MKDKNRSFVVIKHVKRVPYKTFGICTLEEAFGRFMRRKVCSTVTENLAPMTRETSVFRRHACRKGEQPGTNRAPRVVRLKLAVHAHEDLAHEIIAIAHTDAEPPKRCGHIRSMHVEDGPKRLHCPHLVARALSHQSIKAPG
jgi:hypothetical protein